MSIERYAGLSPMTSQIYLVSVVHRALKDQEAYLIDDSLGSDSINFSRFHDGKSAVAVVVIV